MFMLFAALVSSDPPVWWNDFKREHDRCGLVYNVDGHGPPGDGVLFEKDYSSLVLSRSPVRPREPIRCIAAWAKKHGLKVHYKNF
jgi:hypothetical protein